ncbi:MAG: type II toxin-antitoxin system Phd/YefM family antitoxin [Gemmatimonadota bacterium]|nr:type II toxin-antitoxin system Phd/YefM family antitoxin [Gemmatimonadota bacterium]
MSDNTIPASEARKNLADLLNKVSVRGDRIVMERHGKSVAAMISMEDLALLEALEDRYDVEAARSALAESSERVRWDDLRAQLGL